jgi:hypothetical protein
VVTLFSVALYEGQRRGLDQHLRAALRQLGRISPHPQDGIAGARRQVERILGRQYVRQVLKCEVRRGGKRVVMRPGLDELARQKMEQTYFGFAPSVRRIPGRTRSGSCTRALRCCVCCWDACCCGGPNARAIAAVCAAWCSSSAESARLPGREKVGTSR